MLAFHLRSHLSPLWHWTSDGKSNSFDSINFDSFPGLLRPALLSSDPGLKPDHRKLLKWTQILFHSERKIEQKFYIWFQLKEEIMIKCYWVHLFFSQYPTNVLKNFFSGSNLCRYSPFSIDPIMSKWFKLTFRIGKSEKSGSKMNVGEEQWLQIADPAACNKPHQS